MFWKKFNSPEIVITDDYDDLNKYIKYKFSVSGIKLPLPEISSLTDQWAMYAYIDGYQHGLNIFETASFSNAVAQFLSGMGSSSGTEAYYKEEKIDNELFHVYDDTIRANSSLPEEEQQKELYYAIQAWYKENIKKYEKVCFYHTATVKEPVKKCFEDHGTSIRGAVMDILTGNWIPDLPDMDSSEKIVPLSWSFTLSEEQVWTDFGEDKDTPQLLKLLIKTTE